MKHGILKTLAIALSLTAVALPQATLAGPAKTQKQIKIKHTPRVEVLGRSGGGGGGGTTQPAPVLQGWMHPDIAGAWGSGYFGQGTTLSVVDDFTSGTLLTGDIGNGTATTQHGNWTSQMASMVAPQAALKKRDFIDTRAVALARRGLNVINMSYGMFGDAGYTADQISWSPRESSIISYAANGRAVISKAAGNDAVAIGEVNAKGKVDYMNGALLGKQSAIFVGALSSNGSVDLPASMARYSNTAGSDPAAQNQFLTVGVEGSKTGLYGTSFAAPVVSGYASILGSKFNQASPTQIANQLLNTARQDTLTNYDPAIYGRGEASLSRALAPVAIQ